MKLAYLIPEEGSMLQYFHYIPIFIIFNNAFWSPYVALTCWGIYALNYIAYRIYLIIHGILNILCVLCTQL